MWLDRMAASSWRFCTEAGGCGMEGWWWAAWCSLARWVALGLHAETNDQSGERCPSIPADPCNVPAPHLQELFLGSAAVTQGALHGVVGGSKDSGHQAGVVQRGCMVQRAGEEEEGGSARD